MALFFEISHGDIDGKKYLLADGLRIGRSKGEIRIDDAKASSLHAQVEQDSTGAFYIKDMDSTNGIKINGLKAKRGLLEPGVRVQIGRTVLKVVEGDAAGLEPSVPPPIIISNARRAKKSHSSASADWIEKIDKAVSQLPLQTGPVDPNLSPFAQAIQLSFIEGIQADAVVTLGYGPRKAGAEALDIELLDPESPLVAFEIKPNLGGEPIFSTQFPRTVLVNNEGLESRTLYPGDLIRVGKTLIRVDFI